MVILPSIITAVILNIMPKLCIGCNETKSKSLFVKGRVVCKECDKDRGTSVATSTVGDDEDGVIARVDVIYNAIPKIFEKLENISRELQEIRDKLSKDTSGELDVISARLSLIEESSAKLVASNALRNLSARLTTIPPDDVDEKLSESCIAM